MPPKRMHVTQYILLISYTILLFLLLYRFQTVWTSLKWFLHILSPLFSGIALAFVFHLPMQFFQYTVLPGWERHPGPLRRKTWRGVSMLLAYSSVFLVVGILLALVLPNIMQSFVALANNFGAYLASFQRWADGFLSSLSISPAMGNAVSEIWGQLISLLQRLLGQIVNSAFQFTLSLTSGFVNLLFALMLSGFMLYNRETLCSQFRRLGIVLLGSRATAGISHVLQRVNLVFSRFILGQLTEAFLLGTLCFIGMTLLRLEYALLISAIIAITALMPILGAWAGTIPSAMILLVIEPAQALWFLLFILLLQQLENSLLYPRIVGNAIGLPGLFVLAGILIGGGLFGVWGMLLGTPVTAVCYQLIREWLHKREGRILD